MFPRNVALFPRNVALFSKILWPNAGGRRHNCKNLANFEKGKNETPRVLPVDTNPSRNAGVGGDSLQPRLLGGWKTKTVNIAYVYRTKVGAPKVCEDTSHRSPAEYVLDRLGSR